MSDRKGEWAMNFRQCHMYGECIAALKTAVDIFEKTPKSNLASRKRNWAALLFELRKFFQTAEIVSNFNSHCTAKSLRARGILKGFEQPNSDQLCRNFMNEGGNVSFRKKWPLIRREILSPLNRWGAAQRFSKNPNAFECAIHYLEVGGLDRFWVSHPEFLRQEKPELVFEEDLTEDNIAVA
jgi:hypothetical protein